MLDALYQEGTDRVLDDLARRPARPAPAPDYSVWRGVPRALGSGAAAFGAERAGFWADVAGAFGESLATTEGSAGGMFALQSPQERTESLQAADRVGQGFSSDAGDLFRNVARSYRPDAATAHWSEQVVFDLTRGLLKAGTDVLTFGPAGALLSAADEGSMVADDLRQEGVDLGTRTAVGAVGGAALGAGAVLPLAGTTVAKTAALYALGGPVSFMAQQQATRAVLQAADYDKIASRYDPLDPVGLAVASLIPAPFAVYGFRSARARTAAQHVTPEQADAARVAHLVQEQQTHSLAEPADLKAHAAEARAIETAEMQLARGERVDVTDIVQERAALGRAYDEVRASSQGDRFDPLVEIKPADIEAVAVSRGGWKKLGDAEVRGAGFGLVKFIWRHGEESDKPPAFQVSRDDVLAFPEIIRRYEPAEEASGDRGRAWRVEREGPDGEMRTLVYADSVISGAEGRHLVTVHVQEPGASDTKVMSKEKSDWSESLGKRLQAHTEDTGRTLVARRGSEQSDGGIVSERLGGFADRIAAGVRSARVEAKAQGLLPERASAAEPSQEAPSAPPKPAAEGTAAPASPGQKAETGAANARLAEIERQYPDLQVMLDGMDKPMRLSDFLAAVKAETDAELADAPLYQLAAECALLNGFSR
ncbi:hypothetical protein C1M51_02755 [Methylibium sp. Pch-M]|uniref:hypothetical protein n=1 Tax=Methylibium sp. Pch-M TaxID=2082386 RepID=UPI0010118A56|nr:hypothetical protein [Methylibium sp. Pch-M]QAZ38425.1 hypothetical protein C1M51_02755 [Methylibium sp. Pch-M]